MAASGRNKSIANFDKAVSWLPLEADPSDDQPVGQQGDSVVSEWLLLSNLRGGTQKGFDCANITIERKVIRPRVRACLTSGDDPLPFCDINRV